RTFYSPDRPRRALASFPTRRSSDLPDTAGAGKPAPRIFEAACAQARVAPENCWHVGDQLHADALGAMGVGMHPVLVDREGRHTDRTDLTVIGGLDRLPALVRGAGRAQGAL